MAWPTPPDDGHIVPLRPYGVSELFTGAGRVLLRAPRPILISGVIAGAVAIGLQLAAGPASTVQRGEAGQNVTHFHAWGFVAGFVPILAAVIVQAVTVQVALSLTAAALPDNRRIYARAMRVVPWLLAIELVRLISLVVLGLFVVGVFLFVQWSLAGYVLIVEGTRFVDAFRRSADLVRGSWWRVAGLLALAFLVTSVPQSLAQGIFDIRPGDSSSQAWWPGVIASGIVFIPLSAFGAAFVSLLYVDLRCRSEGLAWKLDAARRGPQREPFGPTGVYAALPWRPKSNR